MIIAMDKLCMVFSKVFDIIEHEQLGASENHGLRVAVICIAVGRLLGYDNDTLSALATCGMFHDSALTEYHLSQKAGAARQRNMLLHCEKGQETVSWLPFKTNIDELIMYHHERGDGKGPFGKKEDEIPLNAAIIAAADAVDAAYHLQRVKAGELADLRKKIALTPEAYSTRKAVGLLLEVLDEQFLERLLDANIYQTMQKELPCWEVEVTDPRVIEIGEFIARVIDYKSVFTHVHTSQISNRAWLMAEYYGYDVEQKNALFLAASLHDIGKIGTPTEILEKPGKLDDNEFSVIKNHVKNTLDWLGEVPDFEPITSWAADHHEKLNGFGYSQGKAEDNLDFNSRLMACIDIYQAVSEPRPYHGARTHEETMRVLYEMSSDGYIDSKIVKDLDSVMAVYSMRSVPSPFDRREGEEPKRAEQSDNRAQNGYFCNVCGYFYEGDDMPEDFICPVCRNNAGHFTKAGSRV